MVDVWCLHILLSGCVCSCVPDPQSFCGLRAALQQDLVCGKGKGREGGGERGGRGERGEGSKQVGGRWRIVTTQDTC